VSGEAVKTQLNVSKTKMTHKPGSADQKKKKGKKK